MKWNLPNVLTVFRMILIPVFIVTYYLPFSWANIATAAVFTLAAVTDWFDGFFARILNQTSAFGAFLDPVADKLMVAVALVLLVASPNLPYLALPAMVIIGREIVVSALREWMAEIGNRASIKVSWLGKIKTTVQMVAIIVLLVCHTASAFTVLVILGYLLLYVAAVLTLWSMAAYLIIAWPYLMDKK